MSTPTSEGWWRCEGADCNAATNTASAKTCEFCGAARPGTAATTTPTAGEWVPPWRRPGFKLAQPADPCTEDGCTKTVQQHMDEFRELVERKASVFMPSRPPRPSAEELRLAAELLQRRRRESA